MVDINGMVYYGNILWYYISTYHTYLLYKSVQKILLNLQLLSITARQ